MLVPSISTKLSQNVLSQAQPANPGLITSIFQVVFSAIQSTFNSTPVKAAVGFVTSKTGMITLVGIGALIASVWIYKHRNRESQSNTSGNSAFEAPRNTNPASQTDSQKVVSGPSENENEITHEDVGQTLVDFGKEVVEEVKKKPWTSLAAFAQGASTLPDAETQQQAVKFWKDTATDGYDWAQENKMCQKVVAKTKEIAESGKQKLAAAKDTIGANLKNGGKAIFTAWNNPTEFKDRAVENAKAGVEFLADRQVKKQEFENQANEEAWEMCKSGYESAKEATKNAWIDRQAIKEQLIEKAKNTAASLFAKGKGLLGIKEKPAPLT